MKKIILAGGCFWGVEAYFKRLKGVLSTRVGYTDGFTMNPTYEEVCAQNTNHVEACEIYYDEQVISLERLLEHLFKIIDHIKSSIYPQKLRFGIGIGQISTDLNNIALGSDGPAYYAARRSIEYLHQLEKTEKCKTQDIYVGIYNSYNSIVDEINIEQEFIMTMKLCVRL